MKVIIYFHKKDFKNMKKTYSEKLKNIKLTNPMILETCDPAKALVIGLFGMIVSRFSICKKVEFEQ